MRAEIVPAILTHNLEEYTAKLELLERSTSLWAHLDIMDGQFVPNITVMPHEIMGIPTKLRLEVHLMTFAPERHYSDLAVLGVLRVLLHREAFENEEECCSALLNAKDYFSEVGLVYSPKTQIVSPEKFSTEVIQIMGVEPGASGQAMLDDTWERVKQVADSDFQGIISVDGGINESNIQDLRKNGAERFIIASRLFASSNITQNVQHFNRILTEGI